jgi:hypothetical protein
MKILIKKLILVLILCLIFIHVSCGEFGGTIIIKNNYSEEKTVRVYSEYSGGIVFSYKKMYGPIVIAPGNTGKLNVDTNSRYGIIWRPSNVNSEKVINVSNGETVEINIP